jgi:hypothetical protein
MTMTNLISKRVAEGMRDASRGVNSRLSRASAGIETVTALEEWGMPRRAAR